MCAWLRNTARRGRAGVPESFLRMRALMRCRMSSLVLTFMAFLFRAFPTAAGRQAFPVSLYLAPAPVAPALPAFFFRTSPT